METTSFEMMVRDIRKAEAGLNVLKAKRDEMARTLVEQVLLEHGEMTAREIAKIIAPGLSAMDVVPFLKPYRNGKKIVTRRFVEVDEYNNAIPGGGICVRRDELTVYSAEPRRNRW